MDSREESIIRTSTESLKGEGRGRTQTPTGGFIEHTLEPVFGLRQKRPPPTGGGVGEAGD